MDIPGIGFKIRGLIESKYRDIAGEKRIAYNAFNY